LGYFYQFLTLWFLLFSTVLTHGFAATLHRRINKLSVRSPFSSIPSIAGDLCIKQGSVSAGTAIYPGILFLYKKRTIYLLAVPQLIWLGIMHQSVACIIIQRLRNHECHSEPFSWGKTYDLIGQAGKTHTGRFSGARYVTLW